MSSRFNKNNNSIFCSAMQPNLRQLKKEVEIPAENNLSCLTCGKQFTNAATFSAHCTRHSVNGKNGVTKLRCQTAGCSFTTGIRLSRGFFLVQTIVLFYRSVLQASRRIWPITPERLIRVKVSSTAVSARQVPGPNSTVIRRRKRKF